MKLRIATLVCLTGLAACSNTPEARQPNQATNESDANLRPASLEEASYADGTKTTPRADGSQPTEPAHGTQAAPATASRTPADERTTETERSRDATAPSDARDAAAQPDNTRVNERDRSAAATTPIDQGNNRSDLDITQRIRQGVMADDSLSFTAKNVKIITTGGKVTLRGPVPTEHERAAIYAAARQVVGPTQIDNQIEVKK